MNLLGWLITCTLVASSLVVIMSHGKDCPCFPWQGLPIPDQLRCRSGKLYEPSDLMSDRPKGPCQNTTMQYANTVLKCVRQVSCVDYLTAVLKGMTIFSLPLLVTHDKRMIIHALLNAVEVRGGAVNFRHFDLVMLLVIGVGVFGFEWNLGNGEGFFGPIRRYRARTAGGRFAN